MSLIVIRVLGTESNYWPRPLYILDYNVDASWGRGSVTFAPRAEQACRFKTLSDAQRAYTSKSRVKPVRPDGKPNRPMTVWKVEMLSLSAAMKLDALTAHRFADNDKTSSPLLRQSHSFNIE